MFVLKKETEQTPVSQTETNGLCTWLRYINSSEKSLLDIIPHFLSPLGTEESLSAETSQPLVFPLCSPTSLSPYYWWVGCWIFVSATLVFQLVLLLLSPYTFILFPWPLFHWWSMVLLSPIITLLRMGFYFPNPLCVATFYPSLPLTPSLFIILWLCP